MVEVALVLAEDVETALAPMLSVWVVLFDLRGKISCAYLGPYSASCASYFWRRP